MCGKSGVSVGTVYDVALMVPLPVATTVYTLGPALLPCVVGVAVADAMVDPDVSTSRAETAALAAAAEAEAADMEEYHDDQREEGILDGGVKPDMPYGGVKAFVPTDEEVVGGGVVEAEAPELGRGLLLMGVLEVKDANADDCDAASELFWVM